MSHTLHPLRRQRLQRSELAVPASNPAMIDRAAGSAADYVFLDLEDAVAPPEKEQARRNCIQALNDIDWAAKGKTVSVRSNEAGNFYSAEKLQAPVTIWMSWGGAVRQMPALTGGDVARFGRCNECHRPGGDAEGYLEPPN